MSVCVCACVYIYAYMYGYMNLWIHLFHRRKRIPSEKTPIFSKIEVVFQVFPFLHCIDLENPKGNPFGGETFLQQSTYVHGCMKMARIIVESCPVLLQHPQVHASEHYQSAALQSPQCIQSENLHSLTPKKRDFLSFICQAGSS